MKSIIVIVLFIINFLGCKLYSQKNKEISLALLSESVSLSFVDYLPVHPGLEAGINIRKNEAGDFSKKVNCYLGGYYHKKFETSIFSRIEFLCGYKIKEFIRFDLLIGTGYIHTFYPGELYSLNKETGEFLKIPQYGRPHINISTGIGVTFLTKNRFEPFVRNELFIESPYAKGIPFLPHNLLKLGVNYNLTKQ